MDQSIIRKLESLEEKQALKQLLLDADPEWDVVMEYLPGGEVFALYLDGVPVCEAVMTRRDEGIELKNFATDPAHQRMGYGTKLLGHLFEHYKGKCPAMFVGTAFPGLYERWGFEYAYTVPNFFIDNYVEQPIMDQGRRCIDMIYYRRTL